MIYRFKYDWNFSQSDIINQLYKNKSIKKELGGNTSPNTDEIVFKCKEFSDIEDYVFDLYQLIKGINVDEYAFNMWSYIQNKNTKDEVYHRHLSLDGSRTEIPTDYTFCFYVQIPTNINEGEGDLLLKKENGKIEKIIPNEGDIIFFPGNIWHVPTLTPNSEKDRIVIAGNINCNFLANKNLV